MTKEEIDMFNHPRIQEGWKPEDGDFVALKCEPDLIQHHLDLFFECMATGEDGEFLSESEKVEVGVKHAKKVYIFLPSIEQMEKIWCDAKKNLSKGLFLQRLYQYYLQSWEAPFDMRIIVLHFLMSEWGLTWKEGEWVEG
jgi:hypothetical protein